MRRRRLSLTTRGAFALGVAPTSAVAGLLLGAEELVLLALALATLLAGGLVQGAARARRAGDLWRLTVRLSSSDAEVGSEQTMTVTLAAAGSGGSVPTWLEDPSRCWQRVVVAVPTAPARRPLANPTSALGVPLLEGEDTASFRFPLSTEHRGVFALSGPRLWCFDSVGLFAQLVGIGPSATLVVHPVPTPVAWDEQLLRGQAGPEDSREVVSSAPTRRSDLGDFAGLRAYVPGDRLRLLYWPALARTGELLVRDFEDIAPHRVHLLVDVRPLIGFRGTEAVLAAAAGIGLQALAHGSTVELATSSGELIAIAPGPLADTELLRAVAAIASTPPPSEVRRRSTRRPAPSRTDAVGHGFAWRGGTPLVITTYGGADALPGSIVFDHVVIAA